jgi:hypothetical protein
MVCSDLWNGGPAQVASPVLEPSGRTQVAPTSQVVTGGRTQVAPTDPGTWLHGVPTGPSLGTLGAIADFAGAHANREVGHGEVNNPGAYAAS